ncbi:MAG: hypothetical protein AB7V26_11855 [Lysobacterales bacterium]
MNLLIDGAQFPIFKYNGQSLLMRDLILATASKAEAAGPGKKKPGTRPGFSDWAGLPGLAQKLARMPAV